MPDWCRAEFNPRRFVCLSQLALIMLIVVCGILASCASFLPRAMQCPQVEAGGADTLLGLAALGAGLLARERGWRPYWTDGAAALVALLIVVPPLQMLLGAAVGDGPAGWPGRMAMFDMLALMLAALCLVVLPRLDAQRAAPVWLALLTGLFALVVIGTLGTLIGIPLLVDPWGRTVRMGPATALGLLVVVFVLFRQGMASHAVTGYFDRRPDRMIFSVSAVGLLTVLLLGGMLSSGVLARSGFESRRAALVESLHAHLVLAEAEIANARAEADAVARRLGQDPRFALDRGVSGPDLAIRIESLPSGRIEPEGIPLDRTADTAVFERLGWWLQVRRVLPASRVLVVERRFAALDRLAASVASEGRSGELAVCGAQATAANLCRAAPGTPAARALAGESAVAVVRDDRQHEVLAVFAPLGEWPVAVGLKVDMAGLQADLRRLLWWVAAAIVLAALCGGALIYHYVQPVVRSLSRTESRLKALLESVPVGVVATERGGAIHALNQAASVMFAVEGERMKGCPIEDYLPGFVIPPDLFAATAAGARDLSFELDARRADGGCFPAEVVLRAYTFEGTPRLVFIVQDISDRRVAERALRRTEQALRRAQAVAHVGSGYVDAQGEVRAWSDEIYHILGLAPGVPLDHARFMSCIHPDDRVGVAAAWQAGIGGTAYDIKHRVLVDGGIRWVRTRAESERGEDGAAHGMTVTVQDITESTVREVELLQSRQKLRELAAYHEQVREDERSHIAREIHDELGQHLTALRMDAALLRIHFGDDNPALAERVTTMKQLIDRTIKVVRGVASSLRPAVLDLGLQSAAEWLVSEFRQRTGVACTLRTPAEGECVLDDARATVVFRILQESLTNIKRHAGARHVDIGLTLPRPGLLRLEVRDDGIGFDPAEVRGKKTFGLMGIRERAIMFGGIASFISRPGEGTLLRVELPVPDNTRGEAGWYAS